MILLLDAIGKKSTADYALANCVRPTTLARANGVKEEKKIHMIEFSKFFRQA